MGHPFVVVYQSPERGACMEMRLVLDAVGLVSRVSHRASHWQLSVREHEQDLALAELSAYERDELEETAANSDPRGAVEIGGAAAIVVFAMIIITIALANWYTPGGPRLSTAGHVDAGLVQDGQWWRSVTALTLHVDWTHLMSNLVFGSLFGYLASRWLGGGVAWLVILVGGAAGNLINAYFHDVTHLSVGASTAVFAALGIAVANALRSSLKTHRFAMRRWSPLIAGALLLVMTGTGGERTDVGAHVAGFFTGLAGGWLSSYLPHRWLVNATCQGIAGGIAVVTIIAAWMLGLNLQ